jgi:hypothetical protein
MNWNLWGNHEPKQTLSFCELLISGFCHSDRKPTNTEQHRGQWGEFGVWISQGSSERQKQQNIHIQREGQRENIYWEIG